MTATIYNILPRKYVPLCDRCDDELATEDSPDGTQRLCVFCLCDVVLDDPSQSSGIAENVNNGV